jgi:hypothetical protein
MAPWREAAEGAGWEIGGTCLALLFLFIVLMASENKQ